MDSVVWGGQSTGGLVAQQDGRLRGQGPGDAHPLLLTAGKLADIGIPLVLQFYKTQDFLHPGGNFFFAGALQNQWDRHILKNRFRVQQVELLEHHSDFSPYLPQFRFGKPCEPVSIHSDSSAVRRFQPVDHADQGGLSRPGKADDPVNISLFHMDGNIFQRIDGSTAADITFADMVQMNHVVSLPVSHQFAYPAYRLAPRTNASSSKSKKPLCRLICVSGRWGFDVPR